MKSIAAEYDQNDDTPSLEWQIGHLEGVVEAYKKERDASDFVHKALVKALRYACR